MTDVTLTVANADTGRPARVQVLDASHNLHGEVVLGPAQRDHRFDLPKGPYIIQVERAGAKPERVLRMLETDDRLDIAVDEATTREETATQPDRIEAIRRRTMTPSRRTRGRAQTRGVTGLRVPDSVLGVPTRRLGIDPAFIESLLARYAGLRRNGTDVSGDGVVPERSGYRLPERSGETPAAKRRAKLRSRFRLSIADHATIDGQLRLTVEDSSDAPGDTLVIHGPDGSDVTVEEGYQAPLIWLQERKSAVGNARFIAVPLFGGKVALGFDEENSHLVRVGTGKPEVDALLALLSSDVAVKADAVADQVFTDSEQYDDGMGMEEVAYRLLKGKFLDPYAAAVAGYFMIRFNRFALLRDWSRNLADYFPFMSDGCIIEGWRRLIVRGERANPPWPGWRLRRPPPASPLNPQPNAERPDDAIVDAAQRFLEAHARGLPTLHYGLVKHLEGLMFCFDRTDDAALKNRLEAAVKDMSTASRRAYPSAGLTTIAPES